MIRSNTYGKINIYKRRNFNEYIDPKCQWAVQHLEEFPVEVNKADYYTLLRVPGIGTKSAKRIITARRHAKLDFDDIKNLACVGKHFILYRSLNEMFNY